MSLQEEGGVRLDSQTVERIARRVAELLRSESSGSADQWMTAADIAKQYAVSRAWVYENAESLGVVRLGTGKKARLRFDPARVREQLESEGREARPSRRRQTTARRWVPEADLIPIRGH
jgi:hypothetical protein